ncbi:MAG: M6 family metalloprotease domain-containing protein [Puniceicoccaceae bacterium]
MKRFTHNRRLGVVAFSLPKILLLIACTVPTGSIFAIQANPDPYIAHQPDGTEIQLRLRGDEWFHVEQDVHGFTVIRDRGWYVYGKRDQASGRLVSSGLRVGVENPKAHGLRKGELPSAKVRAERARALGHPLASDGSSESAGGESPAMASATSGVLKNLVVLIRWLDHAGRTLPSTSDVDILMNAPGGDPVLAPTGSVRDVYLENSYGMLSLESTVAVWVTSDNTETYYANGNSGLTSLIHAALRDALTKVDAFIDFSEFDQDGNGLIDSITFLHSGYGAEWGGSDAYGTPNADRIWSHKWTISGGWTSQEGVAVSNYHISPAVWGTSGSAIGRIGVIAHETGHFLGLPDLYDTDSGAGEGIGSFGLMANSWGFDGSQKSPPHMCPWSKVRMGWLSPTVIDAAGTYTLNEAEFNAQAYRIDLGYPSGEYLLLENRQPTGFDWSMPQGGLVIWHIDESAGYNTQGYPSGGSWTGSHYRVAVLQADGAYDLEQGRDRGDRYDPWHAGGNSELTVSVDPNTGPWPNTDAYQGNVFVQTNNRIYNISPSGPSMTFSFEVIGTPDVPPAAPSGLVATAASYDSINLSWVDNSTDESSFRIERSPEGTSWSEISSVSADVTSYTDTGLSPSTTLFYRVRAANIAGNSAYTSSASATTDPPPPPPSAPSGLVATTDSDAAISLSWLDNSSDEDAFIVRRTTDNVTWIEVATLGVGSTSYQDTGLIADTTYTYQVFSSNIWGESGSNTAFTTTDPPPAWVDAFAAQDIPVSGSVQGSYPDTHSTDGIEQVITETESGGKPSRRRSFAEHQWSFPDVRGGLAITLFVNAWAPANAEGDDFHFEISTDGGNGWTAILTVPQNSAPGTVYSGVLPGGDPADIIVRVVDGDGTQGYRSLDSVRIDQLYLRTDLDPNDSPPNPPSGLSATVVSSTEVQLTWSDNSSNERGFRVMRSIDGTSFTEIGVAPVDATEFTDGTAIPNGTYWYQVVAYTASFSADSNIDGPVTTPDGIALQAAGSKKRGKAVVDLTWQGGSSVETVDILRSVDGGAWETIATVPRADGAYTDNTGLKGGPIIDYQVCADDNSVCSDIVTVAF